MWPRTCRGSTPAARDALKEHSDVIRRILRGSARGRFPPGLVAAVILGLWVAGARADVIDDFSDTSGWTLVAADGVKGAIVGVDGALRLDYDFSAGAGYCVARRRVDLPLDPNYRFAVRYRGEGPRNTIEFKLVDPSGENVWWNVRRGVAFPADWSTLSLRKRNLSFAWGPSGGKPLTRVGYIEVAVTADAGGRGSLWLDDLVYEALPEIEPEPVEPRVFGTDGLPLGRVGADGSIRWASDGADVLELRFDELVAFSGIELRWAEGGAPDGYRVEVSADGDAFRSVGAVRGSDGGADVLFTPECEARVVRCVVDGPAVIAGVRFLPVERLKIANDYFAMLAEDATPGAFPPYFGSLSAWTVIGLPGRPDEALVSAVGAVEPVKAGPALEPFLVRDGRVLTWADATIGHTLEDGSLPIPSVRWTLDGLVLDITAVVSDAGSEAGVEQVLVRYTVTNTGFRAQSPTLALAARPFQVLPAAQFLNTVGGAVAVESVEVGSDAIRVDGRLFARADRTSNGAVAADAPGGGLVSRLADPMRRSGPVGSRGDFPSGAMLFDLAIEPGASESVVVTMPMGDAGAVGDVSFERVLDHERARWRALLNGTDLLVPESAVGLRDTMRANLAYILIHADGPGIQPGSRTYERSWIRDGAMTSAALIALGRADEARSFIEWYAGYQYENGKIPCVVDYRGPDPVDENDAPGEFLFAIRNSAEAGGVFDAAFARSMYPRVRATVGYIDFMRSKRLTDAYTRSEDPVLRACAGLMPESISHEGYSEKPMHSYWDDFWVYKGLRDAAVIAGRLGERDDQAAFTASADAFGRAISRSVALATAHHGIGYVPGCVELGDFDATSTAIAYYPTGAAELLDPDLLASTFERAWAATEDRINGSPWEGMTPYEVRVVGTFIRLGWVERAHVYMDWLMGLRDPAGWRQWGEIAWRERAPSRFVGDMPHTWVGSGAILSILSMFAYEQRDALVLAGGVPTDWLAVGRPVGVRGQVTRYGTLSYTARLLDDRLVIEIEAGCEPPSGWRIDAGRLLGTGGGPAGRLSAVADGRDLEVDAGGIVRAPGGVRRIEIGR
tara:strand:- start:8115 stop:11330 length:3216 start_codon:yes stop_codon:yes gene_type:complete